MTMLSAGGHSLMVKDGLWHQMPGFESALPLLGNLEHAAQRL